MQNKFGYESFSAFLQEEVRLISLPFFVHAQQFHIGDNGAETFLRNGNLVTRQPPQDIFQGLLCHQSRLVIHHLSFSGNAYVVGSPVHPAFISLDKSLLFQSVQQSGYGSLTERSSFTQLLLRSGVSHTDSQ